MVQSTIPWYYVYSQRYDALHRMFQDSIKDNRFTVKPYFVDQSEFAKTTYQNVSHHYLCGCMIKWEVARAILHRTEPNTYILFTDVDFVMLNQTGLYEYLESVMERKVDICFMWEGKGKEDPRRNSNLGFCLVRATPEVLAYFDTVLANATDPELCDMDYFYNYYHTFHGTIETADRTRLCLSNYFAETEPKSDIHMVQLLCNNHKDYRLNMQEKYYGAKAFGIPIEMYINQSLQSGISMEELGLQ